MNIITPDITYISTPDEDSFGTKLHYAQQALIEDYLNREVKSWPAEKRRAWEVWQIAVKNTMDNGCSCMAGEDFNSSFLVGLIDPFNDAWEETK